MYILTLPWILCALLLPFAFCIWRKWWVAAVVIALIVLILNVWGRVFSFGIGKMMQKESDEEASPLKVMAWNIHGSELDSIKVRDVAEMIKTMDVDVVYVTEVDIATDSKDIVELLKQQYPYSSEASGSIANHIFSRFPVDSVQKMAGDDNVIRCRVKVKNRYVAIYGCHLPSNNYGPDHKTLYPDSIENHREAISYLHHINLAGEQRVEQIQAVLDDLKLMPNTPAILMGDMNDVNRSKCLQLLEDAGMTDAWWCGGFGYGATLHYPLPYRIDHIFFSEGLRLKKIDRITANGLSDHDALIAEF